MIPISSFYISSDYRETKRGIPDLAFSIRSIGLLQPLLVRPDGDRFEVLDGRRRFYAITEHLKWKGLEEGTHYIINSSVAALIAQYGANSNREDFSPREEAKIIHDIHNEGIRLAGPACQGAATGGWKISDTAKSIGRDSAFVSRLLSIFKNRELLKDASTVTEALRQIKAYKEKNITTIIRAERTKKANIAPDISIYTSKVRNTDAISFCATLEDNIIDLILTDPPFAINYDDLISTEQYDAKYEDEPAQVESLIMSLIPEYYRILKPNKYIILWTGYVVEHIVREAMKKAGFTVYNPPLIWIKIGAGGKSLQPDIRPGNVAQHAILAWKGMPELNVKGRTNVYQHPIVRSNRIHRAQMPESLTADMIEIFSFEGDIVLDTFAGSLSVLRGAFLTKRRFLGCELEIENIQDGIAYTQEWAKGLEIEE